MLNVLYKFILLFLLITSYIFMDVQAQDIPTISQYIFNKKMINPAFTGINQQMELFFYGESLKRFDNHSYLISVGFPNLKSTTNIGLSLYDDLFAYERYSVVLTEFSHHLAHFKDNKFKIGINAGYGKYKNELTKYKLYPDGIYDPAFEEDVSSDYASIGIGFLYYSPKYYIGLSSPLLFRVSSNEKYLPRIKSPIFYFHSGLNIDVDEKTFIEPSFMAKSNLESGVQLDLSIILNYLNRIKIGGIYEISGYATFIAQLYFLKNIGIGYSYYFIPNINTDNLNLIKHGFSVSYNLKMKKQHF